MEGVGDEEVDLMFGVGVRAMGEMESLGEEDGITGVLGFGVAVGEVALGVDIAAMRLSDDEKDDLAGRLCVFDL